jgi:hypothetical protein
LLGGLWTIDDVRYPNEWWMAKAEGAVMIRIEAPLSVRLGRLKSAGKLQAIEQLDHESETAVDDLKPDYTITNDGLLDDFDDQLLDILTKEAKRR